MLIIHLCYEINSMFGSLKDVFVFMKTFTYQYMINTAKEKYVSNMVSENTLVKPHANITPSIGHQHAPINDPKNV